MNQQKIRPEEFVELIDQLITERLKLHLLQTSPTIDHAVDKRSVVQGFDRRIQMIKSRLAEILGA